MSIAFAKEASQQACECSSTQRGQKAGKLNGSTCLQDRAYLNSLHQAGVVGLLKRSFCTRHQLGHAFLVDEPAHGHLACCRATDGKTGQQDCCRAQGEQAQPCAKPRTYHDVI
jgi:hypothetical protein